MEKANTQLQFMVYVRNSAGYCWSLSLNVATSNFRVESKIQVRFWQMHCAAPGLRHLIHSQIPQWTEMCTFLFWMVLWDTQQVHCGIYKIRLRIVNIYRVSSKAEKMYIPSTSISKDHRIHNRDHMNGSTSNFTGQNTAWSSDFSSAKQKSFGFIEFDLYFF